MANPPARFVVDETGGDKIIVDRTTGLEWQAPLEAHIEDLDWEKALAKCEKSDYAEQDDWRLPNVNELRSLLNYDKHGPATDFPGITEDNDGIFWSSSPYVYIESLAWGVSFASGIVYNSNMDFYYSVRCVRGGP